MKVLHVCLASHYTEGLTYQDNYLSSIHAAMGNEVLIVSDANIISDGKVNPVSETDHFLSNGVRLVRLKYDFIINYFISSKIRKVSRLSNIIFDFKPDVILFHGAAGWEMLSVAKYKRLNPNVKLYIDSHEDFNNSGTNFLSYFFQYRLFNFLIIRKIRYFVDKFLYITSESKDFLLTCYGLKDDEIEYFPLGGIVYSDQEYFLKREKIRSQHNLTRDHVIFMQTGKFDHKKKLIESLTAFISTSNINFRFFVLGFFLPEIEPEVLELINSDSRISYLGWASAEKLSDYLCACDVYVQPGSQSATMQVSLCCRCAVILDDVKSHRDIYCNNGWLLNQNFDIKDVFSLNNFDSLTLSNMANASHLFALNNLDYRNLALRILQ